MRSARWWHVVAAARDDEEGIGLIEVLLATFILSIAIMALASVGLTSLTSLRQTQGREQATNAASAAIEDARARDFSDLSMDTAEFPLSLPDTARAGLGLNGAGTCADDESLVRDGGSDDPIPLQRPVDGAPAHVVYTVVTWADDEDPANCAVATGELKRVITLVTWLDGGQELSVRNETLVAPAGRGLPVPDFELTPGEGALSYTRQQLDADDVTKCIPHMVRNLGAVDTYEWWITEVDRDGDGQPITMSGNGFNTMNNKWRVRAYLDDLPADSTEAPSDDALMRQQDGRLVSDMELEERGTARLMVCYTLVQGTSDDEIGARSTVELRSRFDDERRRSVEHQLNRSGPTRLYLQAQDDLAPHARSDEGVFAPLRMSKLASVTAPASEDDDADPSEVDRTQYLGPELLDWSTDIGDDDLPGLRLRNDGSADLATADWRYQVPATTTLDGGDSHLALYVRPTSAALGLSDAFIAPMPMSLQVIVDVLDAAETGEEGVLRTLATVDHTYDHSGTGWAVQPIDLALPDDVLETGQRLRVRVRCMPSSLEDCHLGYDAFAEDEDFPAFGAYLQVGLE